MTTISVPIQAALERAEQSSAQLSRDREAHRRDLEALEQRHDLALQRLRDAGEDAGELRQVRLGVVYRIVWWCILC